ncbi:MAG: prolyl oligopeptidase family serine peptidase [Acidobacteria bacterium]|nr:prolyl oligopeptidase family serine peptidase [Acidobacteriota bacterium]
MKSTNLSRRDWLQALSLGTFGLASSPQLFAQTSEAAQSLPPLNRFPRMMQDYFVARVREIEAASVKRKFAFKTKADAQAYVRDVKAKIRSCFGPMPAKTPLKAKVTGKVERDAYTIEKVIFESRPGFLVTSNLYIPKNRQFPLPGVVASCGHSNNGKAGDTYQSFAQGLARQGYVVLIFDPIGQGERLQYVNEKLDSKIGNGVQEHLYSSNQQLLTGENFPAWRAWDGIRALDYLLSRPEVDPKHVGLTGNSGGGTMTTWLCGLDERWTMAAPGCFVTTTRRNLENELPQDSEQYPPKMLALGLDHDDFIAAMAPKPVILLTKERDYFDVRGSEEAYARLKHLYTLLGAPDNIAIFTGPTGHGYSQENREAMYRFFNRVTKISDAQTEPALTLEKDATLQCTPRGQVSELKSRTVFSFTSEKSKALAKQRPRLQGEALIAAVTSALKMPTATGKPDARILNRVTRRQYPTKDFTAYAVETEPNVQAIVYRLSDAPHYSRPLTGQKRAVLYVSHLSGDAELREEPLLRELLASESNASFYTCDVRGIGESLPNTCGENHFFMPYGNDYFYAGHSLMLDQPYVGQKTFDVLRVLDWLKFYGHTEIHLAAKGRGAIPATFAALLTDNVVQVTLKHALTSYTDIAESEQYNWPLSCLLPGVLAKFDLPDCYRELEKKKLRQIEPQGAISAQK